MRTWARMMNIGPTSKVKSPAYLYYFSHVPPRPDHEKYRAHAAEILYVFNNLDVVDWAFEDDDRDLAEAMSSYSVRFAKTGIANTTGLPHWATYERKSEPFIEFGDAAHQDSGLLRPSAIFMTDTLPHGTKSREKPRFKYHARSR